MKDKIGALVIGLNGSIGTTLTSGVMAIAKGLAEPIGCVMNLPELAQLDAVEINTIVFSGWDLNHLSHLESAYANSVVPGEILTKISTEMNAVEVLKAPLVGISDLILDMNELGRDSKVCTRKEATDQITRDIANFKKKHALDGVVVLNLSSVEKVPVQSTAFDSQQNFEKALEENDESISSLMLYAYSAIKSGCPFINFTPSLSIGCAALQEMAKNYRVALAGNDGKTGQTLYKTVIAPMLYWRNLKLRGWYSTNILGNKDGFILGDSAHREAKINSKAKVLSGIMGYSDFSHQVSINYYPPRGDSKEAWDSVDFSGWLNKGMSMKIDWLGEDSILAAPLALDLIRLIWLTQSHGDYGVATHLASFFKDPQNVDEHNFFHQMNMLFDYAKKLACNKA